VSSWFSLHGFIEMRGQQNIKFISACLAVRRLFYAFRLIEGNNIQ